MTVKPVYNTSPFWIRLVASAIDYAITGAVAALVGNLIVIGIVGHNTFTSDDVWLVSLSWGLIALAYEVLFIGLWGRTIGKAACRLRVSVSSQSESVPGLKLSFIRFAVKQALPIWVLMWLITNVIGDALSAFLYFWTIVILVSIYKNPELRGIHDRAAGTYVLQYHYVEQPKKRKRRIKREPLEVQETSD